MKSTGTLELPPGAGIELFTPEGERDWVPGWDPIYPGDDRTVFLTHGTIWVTVDRTERHVRYARVTPGKHAGLVSVTVRGSTAEVTYELTALDPAEELPHAFGEMLATWERDIKKAARR